MLSKRLISCLSLVLVFLLFLPQSTIPTSAQPRNVGQRYQATKSIAIDLTTLVNVPREYHQPIQEIMDANVLYLPSSQRFTVSSLQNSEEWLYVTLIPTEVVEADWEIEFAPTDIIELLARKTTHAQWQGTINSNPDFPALAAQVPQEFADFSYLQPAPPGLTVNHLFPWTSGQQWYKTQGWHQGNALDFQPVIRTNPPVHFAVLASETGTLKLICGGLNTNDPYQVHLRIIHADGTTTQYLHLAANTIRYDLVNKVVQRGQFLGELYNGTQGGGGGYQYSTPCGSGTAVHLHFTPSVQNININGYSAHTIANAPFATQYTSSNTRIDNTPTFELQNPSFENGVQGWSFDGTCDYTTYQNNPHHGNAYLAVGGSGSGNCTSVHQDINFPVQAGNTYRFGAWIRSGNGNPLDVSLALWGIGLNPNQNGAKNYIITGSNWKCVEVSFTPQMNHSFFRAQFYMHSTGNNFNIDDAQIRQEGAPFCLNVGEGSSRIQLFQEAYDRNNGHPLLGSPAATAQWVRTNSGSPLVVIQPMETHAYIMHDELKDTPSHSVPAYVLRGPILTHFQTIGGSASWIGVGPTSDQFTNSMGQQQSNFPNGFITWDGTNAQTQAWPTPIEGQWRAEYHNGHNLDASPTWVQNENSINHIWGDQAPGNGVWGVWSDTFSARWTGTFDFAAGDYTFTASADDNIRVWIDSVLVMDTSLTAQTLTRFMSQGEHHIRVEMREYGGGANAIMNWTPATTSCTVTINDGTVYTNQRTVQVRSNVPGASQMLISNDGGFPGATWQAYEPVRSWTLSDPGARIATLIVYTRFRDASGSSVCGTNLIDDIIYDPLPPEVFASVNSTNTWSRALGMGTSTTLAISATDQVGGSGVDAMQISTDPTFPDAMWQPFHHEPVLNEVPTTPLYVRVRDGAGNISPATEVVMYRQIFIPTVRR